MQVKSFLELTPNEVAKAIKDNQDWFGERFYKPSYYSSKNKAKHSSDQYPIMFIYEFVITESKIDAQVPSEDGAYFGGYKGVYLETVPNHKIDVVKYYAHLELGLELLK